MSGSYYTRSSREDPKPSSAILTLALNDPHSDEFKQLTNAIFDALLEKKEMNEIMERIIAQFLTERTKLEIDILKERQSAARDQEKIMQENARLIEAELKKHLGSLPDHPGARELNDLVDQLQERSTQLDEKISSLQAKIDTLQKEQDHNIKDLKKIQDDTVERLKEKLEDVKDDATVKAAVIAAVAPSLLPTAAAIKIAAVLARAQPPTATTTTSTSLADPTAPDAPAAPDAPDLPAQLGVVTSNMDTVMIELKAFVAATHARKALQQANDPQHKHDKTSTDANVDIKALKAEMKEPLQKVVIENQQASAPSVAKQYATIVENKMNQNQAKSEQSVYKGQKQAVDQATTAAISERDAQYKHSPAPGTNSQKKQ